MMRRIRRLICLSICLFVITTVVVPVGATTISDIKNQIEEDKNNLNQITSGLADLEDEQEILEEEISDLDAELINMMTSIGLLEDEIAEKEDEVQVAEADYLVAKNEEEKQYEAMKVRIKYMYETGESNYVEVLLSATSFSDVLNKAAYIEELYEYDRKLLTKFQEIKAEVEELWQLLENEKAALEADREEMLEQQVYLDTLLAKKKEQSENYEAQITKARQEAAAYKTKIKQEEAELSKLQAEERRKAAAASSSNNKGSSAVIITNATGSELGKQIANYACQYVGNPYVAGGTSLTNGADCSGFTYRVYSDFGYSLPRTSYSQRSAGKGVEYANAQPGDLICYEGHVALYIGGGYIVHASSASTGIKISRAEYKTILAVRRII